MATHDTPNKKPPAKKPAAKKATSASSSKPAPKKASTSAAKKPAAKKATSAAKAQPAPTTDAGMLTPPAPPLQKEIVRQPEPAPAAGGAGAPPAGGAPRPATVQPILETDARTFSMLTHLGGVLLGWSGLGWVPALVFYLVYKDRSLLVREHGKQELNLQISVLIWGLATGVLTVITLGFAGILLIPVLAIMLLVAFILQIVASVKAYQGEYFNYGIAFPIIR